MNIDPKSPQSTYEQVLQVLNGPLQDALDFRLPPDSALYRRANRGWQPQLMARMDRCNTLTGDTEEAREAVEEVVKVDLERLWGLTLPDGFCSPQVFQQAASALTVYEPPAPVDRREELRPRVIEQSRRLSTAQNRPVNPGLGVWFTVLAAGAFATGIFWLTSRPVEPLQPIASFAGAMAAIGIAFLAVLSWIRSRGRRTEISAGAAALTSAWTAYRDNTISVAAHQHAATVLNGLKARAEELMGRQEEKRSHICAIAPTAAELTDARVRAMRETPSWRGEIEGGGKALASLIEGPQVYKAIETWCTTDADQLMRAFADYIREHNLERAWLTAAPRDAIEMQVRWTEQRNRDALRGRTAWDAFNLDPMLGGQRLGELVLTKATPATAGADEGRQALQTRVFAECGMHEFRAVIAQEFSNAAMAHSSDPDEIRLLVLGPRQLGAETLLTGSEPFRERLKKGGFRRYIISPEFERIIDRSGIVERLVGGRLEPPPPALVVVEPPRQPSDPSSASATVPESTDAQSASRTDGETVGRASMNH